MLMKNKFLKVLANGYEVPYPDELLYKDIIIMKDYRLNDYPKNSDGEFDEAAPYEEWLSEYLFCCDLNLTEEQQKLADYIDSDSNFSGFVLGCHAGFYESLQACRPSYRFPDDFSEKPDIIKLKGTIDKDPYKTYLKLFEYEGKRSRLEFVMEEYGWHVMKQHEQEEFQKYWHLFVKLEPLHWMFGMREQNVELPDFAWRIYLALILKRIPGRKARIKEIGNFFNEYGDTIHK